MTKCFLFVGQSLNQEMQQIVDNPPASHPDTAMWSGTAWVPPVGNGLIEFCNRLREALNEPVRAIMAAVGGSSLCAISAVPADKYWMNTAAGSPYAAMCQMIDDSGTSIDGIIFDGGQQDYFKTPYGTFKADMPVLHQRLLAKCGKTASQLPLVLCVTGKTNYGTNSAEIRRAQIEYADSTPGVFLAPPYYDLPRRDGTHLYAAGYETLARRKAVTMLAAMGLPGYKYKAARLTGVQKQGVKLLLSFDLCGAGGLWPNRPFEDVTGYDVWKADFSATVPIVEAVIVAPQWIRLKLAYDPGHCHVTYQYGNNADDSNSPATNTNPLGDSFGLPLLPTTVALNAS